MRKLLLLSALCLLASMAQAESDSLDLKKLEDKYWSAKDSDFSVVQNRTYSKAGRYFATLSHGVLLNDPYFAGRMSSLAIGYYKSEYFGFEVSYESGDLQDNDSSDFFKNRYGIKPDTNRFKNYTSLNALWIPIYAKMSFLDKKILYFDMQFAAGLGMLNYEQSHDSLEMANSTASSVGFNFDVTQQVFFHEHFAIRVDIKNKWTTQKLDRWHAGSNPREINGAKTQQDTSILIGLTYFH